MEQCRLGDSLGYQNVGLLDARKRGRNGPSFSLGNRIQRAFFMVVWAFTARWTPAPCHRWRCSILRVFGAKIGSDVRLYGSTKIWHPSNLIIGEDSIIGPRVHLYNQGHIEIGVGAVVSQDAHICASSHDVTDPYFQLRLMPVRIEDNAWVAAAAFVGPGVTVGRGSVLGACAAAFDNLEPWTIYRGNPAAPLRQRIMRDVEILP